MSLQKDVEVLRSIPLFAKIEPAKLKLLAFTSEHLEFAEGDTLCRQGEAGDAAFIVLEGQADVLVENPGGAVKVATIHRNDIVGEIAILCDVPRTATVQATTRLVALRVSKDGFFNLVTQFPQIARRDHGRARLAPARHHPAPDRGLGTAAQHRRGRPGMNAQSHARDLAWPTFPSAALDWLVRESGAIPFVDNLLAELCSRLVEDGLPLARVSLHLRTLHPQFLGARMLWHRGMDTAELSLVGHSMRDDPRFLHSPVRALYEGAEGIRHRLDVHDDGGDEYSIYEELRAEGLTDYVALPLVTTDGKRHATSWSTDQPGGFTTEHLVRISDLMPVLTMAVEIRMNRRIAKNLLNTYVGERAGERVLAGDITRGSGTTIQAAIWNCDLRSFTMISEHWPRDDVISSLNDYFDAMGAPVTKYGGEILKFIGDGMLAIFPLEEEDACVRALRAAIEARQAMIELNQRREAQGFERLGYGLALHVGDVMYGNIGTTTRLDFTVIGPAVNTTARLEGLTKVLHRRVVLSAPFAYRCGCSPDFLELLGSYPLRGVGEPLAVFGLAGDH